MRTQTVSHPASQQWNHRVVRHIGLLRWRLREAAAPFHGASAAIHAMLLLAMLFGAVVPDLRGEAWSVDERVVRLILAEPVSERVPPLNLVLEPSLERASLGASAAADDTPDRGASGPSGRAGTEAADPADIQRQQAVVAVNPSGDVELARLQARDRTQNRGLLAVLNQQQSPFGTRDPNGLDAVTAIGAIQGTQTGSSWGARGLGAYGDGLGAGGRSMAGGFEGGPLRLGRVAQAQALAETTPSPRQRPQAVVDPTGTPSISGQLDASVIQQVVRENRRGIRACYENGLRRSPELAGEVTIQWVIAPDGTVAGASVAESTLADDAVGACLVSRVRQFRFPDTAGAGIVRVSYPFTFAPAM